jgi:hypothetical protein
MRRYFLNVRWNRGIALILAVDRRGRQALVIEPLDPDKARGVHTNNIDKMEGKRDDRP